MILRKIHIEPTASSNSIFEEGLYLNRINLIVGKNASGKSRLVRSINAVADMIDTSKTFIYPGKTHLHFEDINQNKIYYFLHYIGEDVVEERITKNGEVVFYRDRNEAKIRSETRGPETIQPPAQRLIFQSRRDAVEYPVIEQIAEWAEKSYFIPFNRLDVQKGIHAILADINFEQEAFRMVKKLSPDDRNRVISSFNKLGYRLERIEVFDSASRDELYLTFEETGFNYSASYKEMSQGMFRSLMLLFCLEYLSKNNLISTLILDDLGEGLDYERATKLGKLLMKWLEERPNIQFIATSNDSYLMETVPIQYWNILRRENGKIRCFNYQNSKEIFDEFKITGLIPFDLFSSDYLLSKTS